MSDAINPGDVAERLEAKAEQHRFAASQSSLGDGSPYKDAAELFEAAASLIRAQSERERVLVEALKPFADAIAWEEAEGNFGPVFMAEAPAQHFRDDVELRFVAWWGKDEELESADTFCTLGDLRRALKAITKAQP